MRMTFSQAISPRAVRPLWATASLTLAFMRVIARPAVSYDGRNFKFTDLGSLGGGYLNPSAINDHGQVVGTGRTANDSGAPGARWGA